MEQTLKSGLAITDIGTLLRDAYQFGIDYETFNNLATKEIEIQTLLGEASKTLSEMGQDQKISWCEAFCGYFSSDVDTEPIKTALMQGNLDKADKAVRGVLKQQQQSIFASIRSLAWTDAGLAAATISYNLYFIFKGYTELEMKDREQEAVFRSSMERIQRRYDACMRASSVDTNLLQDIFTDTSLIMQNVHSRYSERISQRNMSLVSAGVSVFKCAMNIARFLYLRDPKAVSDTILYGGAVTLNAVSAGTSFVVAYDYHYLANHMYVNLQDVLVLTKKLRDLQSKKEEEKKGQ